MLDAVSTPDATPAEADLLWQAWLNPDSAEASWQAWLALQCSLIPGVSRGVLVLGAPDTGPYVPVCVWPPGQAATALMAEVSDNAVAQRRPLIVSKHPQSVVASLVMVDGHLHGLVAIESSVQHEAELQRQFQHLRWGCNGIESLLRREQALDEQKTRERLMATLDMLASALAEDGFQGAAQALATDLAIRLT